MERDRTEKAVRSNKMAVNTKAIIINDLMAGICMPEIKMYPITATKARTAAVFLGEMRSAIKGKKDKSPLMIKKTKAANKLK